MTRYDMTIQGQGLHVAACWPSYDSLVDRKPVCDVRKAVPPTFHMSYSALTKYSLAMFRKCAISSSKAGHLCICVGSLY